MSQLKQFSKRWIVCVTLHASVTGLLIVWVMWRMPSDDAKLLEWAMGPRDWAAWALWALLPLLGLFDATLPDGLLIALSSAAWGALLALMWMALGRRQQHAVVETRAKGEQVGTGSPHVAIGDRSSGRG